MSKREGKIGLVTGAGRGMIALGRVGQPDDVAKVVTFLASDAGGWQTGQQVDASGGHRL